VANGEAVEREMAVEQAGALSPIEVQIDAQKVQARLKAVADAIAAYAKVSIQNTNPKDWVRMRSKSGGESFYLQASGAQKIRPIWGVYFRDRVVSREDYPDGSYAYIVAGVCGSQILDRLFFGKETLIEIEGGRSSKDSFFTGKDGMSTPDPLDIRKAAIANWEARAITGLLGLKNMTAEDLKKNGIDPAQVKGFEFKEGATGGGQNDLISEAQRKRLYAICKQAGLQDDWVKEQLKTKWGFESSTQVTREKYEEICNWAQAGGGR